MRKALFAAAALAGLGSAMALAPLSTASAAEAGAKALGQTVPSTAYMQFGQAQGAGGGGGRSMGAQRSFNGGGRSFNGGGRSFGGGGRSYGVGRAYGGGGRYYGGRGGYYGGRGYGYGGAGLIGGLAAGALLGGVIASQAAPVYDQPVAVYQPGSPEWLSYCSQTYRSFDPASGTYLGYDGQRHYCE